MSFSCSRLVMAEDYYINSYSFQGFFPSFYSPCLFSPFLLSSRSSSLVYLLFFFLSTLPVYSLPTSLPPPAIYLPSLFSSFQPSSQPSSIPSTPFLCPFPASATQPLSVFSDSPGSSPPENPIPSLPHPPSQPPFDDWPSLPSSTICSRPLTPFPPWHKAGSPPLSPLTKLPFLRTPPAHFLKPHFSRADWQRDSFQDSGMTSLTQN